MFADLLMRKVGGGRLILQYPSLFNKYTDAFEVHRVKMELEQQPNGELRIICKLELAPCNAERLDMLPHFYAKNLPSSTSDHVAILLQSVEAADIDLSIISF